MWSIKKEYKGKQIGIKGFGLLDFGKESAETILKMSLQPQFRSLIKYIQKDVEATKKKSSTKKSSTKGSSAKLHDTE